jgi:RimJ/RimL family protein N-acetyltransferase
MNTQWLFPSRDILLQNQVVTITPVNFDTDMKTLYQAASYDTNQDDLFRYHVNVPIMTQEQIFSDYLYKKLQRPTEVLYKIVSNRLKSVVGCAALMNVQVDHGVIEIGSIWYTKQAQRTEINTNAMYLLFSYVFEELQYRRLEWKCNSKNEASNQAALRLGFEYEGLFRNHYVSRGENRDTAWYSIIDSEWPTKKQKLAHKLELKIRVDIEE